MGNLKPENLVWADQIEHLKGQTTAEKRAELKKAYDLSSSQITNLLNVKACFDQPAIDKVRQAPFIFSLNSAMALAGLKDKVADLPTAVHAVLDIALARRLPPQQIKALVKWVIQGNSADSFQESINRRSPRKSSRALTPPTTAETIEDISGTQQSTISALDLNKWTQLLDKAKVERVQGHETVAEGKLKAYILKVAESLTGSKAPAGSDEVLSETVLLDWLADINIVKQLQSKRKKGKSLTAGEWGVLALHKLGELLGYLAKIILKLFKPFLKLLQKIWKLVIEALKVLGIYPYAKAIMTLVAVIAAVWFAWEAFHYGVMRPVEMVWSKIHFRHAVEESPTPVPTSEPTPQIPYANGLNNVPLAQSNHVARHVASQQMYQPSIPFQPTAENPQILEDEIDAMGPNSRVKDYTVTPDKGIPGDVAVSRVRDLADPDKYTMKIGKDKQTLLSANVTTTGLTINYKSADVFGNLTGSGGGQWNVLWEDFNAIHTNAIYSGALVQSNPAAQLEASPQMPTYYQISAIAEGAKIPFTLQCATTANLQHLVSALEYFIRNSRLGHDAQPGGMPYPDQGLVLSNDGVVDKLWTNSPMDKAGLGLGDHLWSVGKISTQQQNKAVLETGLSSLPVTLFAVSPADWEKALTAKNLNAAKFFSPKLRKITLQAL